MLNSEQLVLFVLTLQILVDLMEFFVVWKEFRSEVDAFENLYYTTDPINPEEPSRSTQLTEIDKRICEIEKSMKRIKLKMFLKLITKFLVESLTKMAGTFIFVLDLCLLIGATMFLFYKHKRY